jgi:hypothetical protein
MFGKYKSRELMLVFFRSPARTFIPALLLAILTQHAQAATTQTKTMVIQNQTGTVVTGLNISTTTGPCIQIINSTNITIEQSQIGPCGTNASTAASQGISISGSSANIYDNYIHVENQAAVCDDDSHDNIFITGSSNNVNIQGNVIAYGEANIKVVGASNVSAIGNFLLNPRGVLSCSDPDNVGGDQFQSWGTSTTQPNTNMTVSNNYTISALTGYLYPSNSSDQINFGNTTGIIAQNNWINGAQYANACGITIDYGSNSAQVIGNTVDNTYNCGIAIATGTNHTVSSNKILITGGGPNAGGIAIVGSFNSPSPCGTITLSYNYAYAAQSSGWVQGYYNDGYCTAMTLTSNTLDVGCTVPNCKAYSALYTLPTTNPPPLIPPQPYSCVATSPYSTQTSKALCSGTVNSSGGSNPSNPPPTTPTASLTASPTSVTAGAVTTLKWSSTDATKCGGSEFTASGMSGSAMVAPTTTTTYSVTCSGAGGSASASASVTVTVSSKAKK